MAIFAPPRRSSPVVRRRDVPVRFTRGRGGLFAASYARMGSGIFLALGIVWEHGAGLTPLAILVAGLLVLAVAASYAEGISLFPEAGGPAALARHGFDDLASFATGWAMSLALLATVALSALFAATYLSAFWAPLATGWWAVAGGLAVVAVISAAAVADLDPSPSLVGFAGIADIALQVLLVLLGLAFAFRPETIRSDVHLGTAPSVAQFVLACALALVAFTGVESIGQTAAEARDPDRDIGPVSAGVLLLAVMLGAAIALAALMAAPAAGASRPARPALGIVTSVPLHVLSTGLRDIVGLLVASLLMLLAHVALRRAAQIALWQARQCQLPEAVAALDPARETPVTAIAACTTGAGLLLAAQGAVGDTSFLAGTYAFGALLAFTSVHAAVIALRWRDPGRYRPVAVPLNLVVDGRRLPLLAVAGGAATALAWLAVVLLEADARALGVAWMLGGVALYVAYRRRRGLSLRARSAHEIAGHSAPGVEVEFHTILIPANTAAKAIPADLLDVAAQLAAERRASVVLLAFTEIPLGEEMDFEIEDLEETVERLAAAGRAVGERYGIRVQTTHLRTRDPAESILAEADRRDSQVILLRSAGLQRADVRQVAYDHAVRRIVTEARQRVMIVRPEQAPA
ncbi:MAG TPA: amino acid permease [Gaiellales bacterium]